MLPLPTFRGEAVAVSAPMAMAAARPGWTIHFLGPGVSGEASPGLVFTAGTMGDDGRGAGEVGRVRNDMGVMTGMAAGTGAGAGVGAGALSNGTFVMGLRRFTVMPGIFGVAGLL